MSGRPIKRTLRDGERAAAAGLAVQAHVTAVRADDVVDHRETNAGTFNARRLGHQAPVWVRKPDLSKRR